MWIDRKQYDALMHELAISKQQAADYKQFNASLSASFDWLRVRVTQLEMERAQLIENYMGVKVAVPQISPAPASVERRDRESASALAAAVAPYFTDMGDEEAAKQGVGWNEEGEVTYKQKS